MTRLPPTVVIALLASMGQRSDEPSSASGEPLTPSDWNNRWYYRGW